MKARRAIVVTCVTTALSLVAALGAWAAPVAQVDQSVTGTGDIFAVEISEIHQEQASQTFTAGVSGQLASARLWIWIDLAVSTAGHLDVVVNPVDGGGNPIPGTVLAAATIPVASLSTNPGSITPVTATFATPAVLTAGTRYALTVSEAGGVHEHLEWSGPGNDTYAGGTGFSGFSGVYSAAGRDFTFETSMVVAATPSSSRSGYCLNGRFLDLATGQPDTDTTYAGATPAIYVKGSGITCDHAPAGYVLKGKTTMNEDVGAGAYDLWAPAG